MWLTCSGTEGGSKENGPTVDATQLGLATVRGNEAQVDAKADPRCVESKGGGIGCGTAWATWKGD
jgi:hypothetical protein